MNNSERSAKVKTYLSTKSMLCAWMTPEVDIKISLNRIERIDCSGQIVQRKEQITVCEEELSTLKRFFPVIDQLPELSVSEMLVSKRGVYLPELVLVPKRQPGVQMDLNR